MQSILDFMCKSIPETGLRFSEMCRFSQVASYYLPHQRYYYCDLLLDFEPKTPVHHESAKFRLYVTFVKTRSLRKQTAVFNEISLHRSDN